MPVDRIRSYTKLLERHNLRHFVIWQGQRLAQTPEFANFRKRYAVRWSLINKVIGALEDLCLQRRITLALVDGNSVNELADQDFTRLKIGDMLKCIHNLDATVEDPSADSLFKRTKSKNVHLMKDVMAMAIQALFRGRAARRRQVDLKYHTTAVIVIQCHYRRRKARRFVLKGLLALREKRQKQWAELVERLHADLLDEPRVEIHVASLNYGETARLMRPRYQLEQAQHLARVLRAVDDDVHVVYVSPLWNFPRTSSTTTAACCRWARREVATPPRRRANHELDGARGIRLARPVTTSCRAARLQSSYLNYQIDSRRPRPWPKYVCARRPA